MDSQLSAMLAPLENAHGPITDQRTRLRTGSVVPNQGKLCEIFEVAFRDRTVCAFERRVHPKSAWSQLPPR